MVLQWLKKLLEVLLYSMGDTISTLLTPNGKKFTD